MHKPRLLSDNGASQEGGTRGFVNAMGPFNLVHESMDHKRRLLHTIGGAEYHDLRRTVGAFKMMGGFQRIILGYPLLATQDDMQRAVEAILANIPKERKKTEAVVLMGHGTHHPSNAFYAALMFQLQLEDPNIFMGTVEGYPEVDLIKELLLKNKIKRAYLMPFMSVAGDHAKNDMAGDEEDSWKTVLTKEGFNVETVLEGLGSNDKFAQLFVNRIADAANQRGLELK